MTEQQDGRKKLAQIAVARVPAWTGERAGAAPVPLPGPESPRPEAAASEAEATAVEATASEGEAPAQQGAPGAAPATATPAKANEPSSADEPAARAAVDSAATGGERSSVSKERPAAGGAGGIGAAGIEPNPLDVTLPPDPWAPPPFVAAHGDGRPGPPVLHPVAAPQAERKVEAKTTPAFGLPPVIDIPPPPPVVVPAPAHPAATPPPPPPAAIGRSTPVAADAGKAPWPEARGGVMVRRMRLRKIANIGHPVLRQKARPVTREELETPAMQAFIDDLIATMRDADGAGLAANQVYEPIRICVIEVGNNPRYPYKPKIPLTVLVNPEIEVLGDETFDNYEGCLSVPDLRGVVARPTRIRVRAWDRHGQPIDRVVEGLSAGTFQHECDHLDGKLFLDRVRDTTTLCTWKEFERHHRDAFVERVRALVERYGS